MKPKKQIKRIRGKVVCPGCGIELNPGSLLAHMSHAGKSIEERRKRLEKANLARKKKAKKVINR